MASPIRPLAAAIALALTACAPAGEDPASGEPGERLATLNGTPIHEADLEEWIREELFADATEGKDEAALFEWKSQALERMIDDQLLAAAAEAQGIDVPALRDQTVAAISISDEEVQTFYEANRARVGQATLEDLSPRIRDFLTQQTQAQEWARYVDGLRKDAEIEIALEAPRVDVAAVGPAKGPEDAPITIVEFSDFNCPFCQRVNPTLAELERRYPEQVRIVFRHYPLAQLHPRARAIAEASVCADEQGRFWEFHDAVFADGSAMADEAIRATAEGVALDLAAFDACLADGRASQVVARDMEAASAAGVTGTPAFFVNGIRLSGAQPIEAFVKLIDKELAATEADGVDAS